MRGAPHFASGPAWLAWLEQRVGTNKWVVTPRLTDRMRDDGYTLAISQGRYRALQQEYIATLSDGSLTDEP